MRPPSDLLADRMAAAGASSAPPRPRAVLVVDDIAVNVMVMTAMLLKAGYEPHVARSGPEGVALAEAIRPDLVLMDIHMPGMTGIDAAQAIRKADPEACAPIIAVTANVSEAQRAACESAGFAAVLHKPLAFEELVGTVRRLLD
jgi:CheY-like chemotaxis protein